MRAAVKLRSLEVNVRRTNWANLGEKLIFTSFHWLPFIVPFYRRFDRICGQYYEVKNKTDWFVARKSRHLQQRSVSMRYCSAERRQDKTGERNLCMQRGKVRDLKAERTNRNSVSAIWIFWNNNEQDFDISYKRNFQKLNFISQKLIIWFVVIQTFYVILHFL